MSVAHHWVGMLVVGGVVNVLGYGRRSDGCLVATGLSVVSYQLARLSSSDTSATPADHRRSVNSSLLDGGCASQRPWSSTSPYLPYRAGPGCPAGVTPDNGPPPPTRRSWSDLRRGRCWGPGPGRSPRHPRPRWWGTPCRQRRRRAGSPAPGTWST